MILVAAQDTSPKVGAEESALAPPPVRPDNSDDKNGSAAESERDKEPEVSREENDRKRRRDSSSRSRSVRSTSRCTLCSSKRQHATQ